jgi:hypothetical protein
MTDARQRWAAPVATAAMMLCPHACPRRRSASYSAQNATWRGLPQHGQLKEANDRNVYSVPLLLGAAENLSAFAAHPRCLATGTSA